MKKISLKNLNLKEVEQLSREQLKDVLGGWTGGTGSETAETQTMEENCDDYPGLSRCYCGSEFIGCYTLERCVRICSA